MNQDAGIIGATSAVANKVLFQITPRDADELAPEFAEKPPIETKLEEQFVVSQNPFYDLLKGHVSPDVRELVDRYIRPMKERLDDIYGDREAERLIRTDYLDEANLYRIDERVEATRKSGDPIGVLSALGSAGRAILQAGSQTGRLKSLTKKIEESARQSVQSTTC